jgi:hypothetical protein
MRAVNLGAILSQFTPRHPFGMPISEGEDAAA